jgi:release factor glutamine methyltransferase
MNASVESAALAEDLALQRPALVRRLIGRAMHLGYRLTGAHRYDDYRFERVGGAHFVVMPSVFNPRTPRTGAFLAANIDPGPVRSHWQVLDMGTGSGVGAVIAARHARRVVAVDINPAAAHCARVNAQLNGVEQRIEVRQGDLFAPVAGERFELVLFNPPFLRASPRDARDRAWSSLDVAERFAAGLSDHLAPGGSALVVLSTFGNGVCFLREFRRCGLKLAVVAERRFVNETLTLFGVSA